MKQDVLKIINRMDALEYQFRVSLEINMLDAREARQQLYDILYGIFVYAGLDDNLSLKDYNIVFHHLHRIEKLF